MPEAVDHPAHYGGADDPYEAIKVIEAWDHLGFHTGNAVKYLARAGKKGDYLEDLKKAAWYLNREIKLQEEAKAELAAEGLDLDNGRSKQITLAFRKNDSFDCWAEPTHPFENIRQVADRAADGFQISRYELAAGDKAVRSNLTVREALELFPEGAFTIIEVPNYDNPLNGYKP